MGNLNSADFKIFVYCLGYALYAVFGCDRNMK